MRKTIWTAATGLLCGHATVLVIDGQWLRGYMVLGLAIAVQVVRAIDDLKR